jgi:hypothetical protein
MTEDDAQLWQLLFVFVLEIVFIVAFRIAGG